MSENKLKIESGIPIPPKRGSIRGKYTKILKQMRPGDSVGFSKDDRRTYDSFRAAAAMLARRNTIPSNYAFVSRKLPDESYRVWCVERPAEEANNEPE